MSDRLDTGTVDWRLYLVTDTAQCAARGRGVAETVRLAVAGGVGVVQVRDKDLDDAAFRALVLDVEEAIARGLADRATGVTGRAGTVPGHDPIDPAARVPLFVNDRAEVAAALIAEGHRVELHIGQGDTEPGRARALIGDDALLGLSASSAEEIARTGRQPVDLLGIGAVWDTATKPDAPGGIGVDALRVRVASAPHPCVAIGGITLARASQLRGTGVVGICVVSAICAAADPADAARSLLAAYEKGTP